MATKACLFTTPRTARRRSYRRAFQSCVSCNTEPPQFHFVESGVAFCSIEFRLMKSLSIFSGFLGPRCCVLFSHFDAIRKAQGFSDGILVGILFTPVLRSAACCVGHIWLRFTTPPEHTLILRPPLGQLVIQKYFPASPFAHEQSSVHAMAQSLLKSSFR
jgi:hypothetical protein